MIGLRPLRRTTRRGRHCGLPRWPSSAPHSLCAARQTEEPTPPRTFPSRVRQIKIEMRRIARFAVKPCAAPAQPG
jgi:hypothetical protein